MESKEVKPLSISVDTAFHISDHLEIEDMEHWAEAMGMQEIFQKKNLHAKQMRKHLESLKFLNVRMIKTLSETDFRLTYRTLQQLTLQAGSPSKLHGVNLNKIDDALTRKVSIGIFGMLEDGTFLEVSSPGLEAFQDVHVRHISDLTQPLTKEMARHLAEGDCFNLLSDFPDFAASKIHTSFLKHLMGAIPSDKLLFVWCPADISESPLKTLIRHCRYYKLQEVTSQMHPNLEIHVIDASLSSFD